MAQDTDEIVVAQDGRIMVAPVGTAAPADVAAAFAAEWVDLGYANENGVRFQNSVTKTEIPVWQLFYAAREMVTARTAQLIFGLRQWNLASIPLAFGGGAITEPAAGVFKYEPPDAGAVDERAMAIEWEDGAKKYRLIVPKGSVSEGVETNLTRSAAADLPITFKVLGSDAAKPFYLLTNDPAFDAGA